MRRVAVAAFVAGVAVGAGVLFAFGRGDAAGPAAPVEEDGLVVQRSMLRPGLILLVARNRAAEGVRIAQVMVNDAFVDFDAQRPVLAPKRAAEIAVHYPWIAGESYEIGLVTSTGAIFEYKVEDAGET